MNCLDKIDLLMSERGINKRALSSHTGVPYTTIVGLYERGVENARISTLYKISQFFNVPLDYLVVDKYDRPEDFVPNGLNASVFAKTDQEVELLNMYRSLNNQSREIVLNTVRGFFGNPDMKKEASNVETA